MPRKDSMMEHEKEELLQERQLAFIGQMLTALMGRIPDHLTGLQASTGSLANLLEQADQDTEGDNGKLVDLLSSIARHLKMFNRKTQRLNRFGQRMDRRLSTFNPAEVIEEAMLFSTRLAHLNKVSLRLEADEALPSLYGDPVSIHFLVSIAIHKMLERMGEGGNVLVSTGPSDKGLHITVAGHGTLEPMAHSEPEPADPYWSIAQRMAATLGGHLKPRTMGPDTKQISLFLPM